MMSDTLPPVSPGELLLEEFMLPMGITRYRVAKEIGVPATRIGEIIAGRRSITADTDLRLCRFLGLSDGYWLRAQVAYDTQVAREQMADELEQITPWPELVDDVARAEAQLDAGGGTPHEEAMARVLRKID
jgi:antitoxin HigA-1